MPRLCVIGPLVGVNRGHVTTQGEVMVRQLRRAGYPMVSASGAANRYVRFADITATIVRQRHAIDVVLLQVYGGRSFVVEDTASRLAKYFGKRVIMHLRGGALPEFFARHPGWALRVLERADLFVAPSEFLRDAVAALGFKARVVPNVIDLDLYPFRSRSTLEPRLLWMRSFHPIYNPLMAVRVLAGLRRSHAGATLVMAGAEKGMGVAILAEAERLGVEHAVRMVGFLDVSGKQREGSLADVFINTNDIDNTPVAVIEAWAMGIPVVATAVGGVPRLVEDGRTGLLVPAGDDAAMTMAVRRLLDDPALAARLSTQGRGMAERSAWAAAGPIWNDIIQDVCAARGAATRSPTLPA